MKYFAIVLILFTGIINLHSQTDTSKSMDKTIKEGIDSTLFDLDDSDFDFKMKIPKNKFKLTFSKPMIEVLYGSSKASYDHDSPEVNSANMSNLNTMELRLGDISFSKYSSKDTSLIKTSNKYLFFKSFAGLQVDLKDTLKQTAEGIGFGWNKSEGYGYKIGGNGFISLYHGDGHYWSYLDIKNANSNNKLDDFGKNELRYGKQFQSGIMISPLSNLNISLEYQRSMVYPRHLFWYELGSGAVEVIAEGALSIFTNKIKKSSPELYPIVKLIFDTSLSYGFYELRKKDMNWPINTASPLLIDSYKVGISYSF
ncbi:MAG: hypothetical protein NTW25_14745 [Candidatus Kapabacteria bacterium]|nr:hypothetical protein [Candidatus Kapabacteria bacterium]